MYEFDYFNKPNKLQDKQLFLMEFLYKDKKFKLDSKAVLCKCLFSVIKTKYSIHM